VILPTTACPARHRPADGGPDYYVAENLLTLRNTRVGNLMGLCGLSLPTGVPSAGI
jgi:aspartyl-tRNA(Asn)/glutamyl-tRNA(Gln) amidotransferase subunit A